MFTYHPATKILKAKLSENSAFVVGSYKIRVTSVVDGYENVYKEFTLKVIDQAAKATISTSGKIDLVNRTTSVLNATVKLTNTEGKISGVSNLVSTNNIEHFVS